MTDSAISTDRTPGFGLWSTADSRHDGWIDLDGDGDLDASTVANRCSQPNRVWINQGCRSDGNSPVSFFDSGQTLGNSHSHGA